MRILKSIVGTTAHALVMGLRTVPVLIRDGVGIAGAGLIVYGTWLIYVPAAYILAGIMLATTAFVLAARKES